jgi:tetratricopeptide (TPR) repeat protein
MGRGLFALLILTSVAAHAEDDRTERARIHVKAAIAYYDEGRYEDAAREMIVAYELKPLADLQYNLAQCYERLGKLEEAASAYEKYLAGRADAPDRKVVQARIENLRERKKAGEEGKPPPAEPQEKVVLKTVIIYKEIPQPGRAARFTAYALWVVAAAGVATGIAYAVLAKQAADEVSRGGNPANPVPWDQERATQESGRTYPIVSGVTFALGAVALAGGIALYFAGNKADREARKQLTLAPSVGPGGGGLAISGAF